MRPQVTAVFLLPRRKTQKKPRFCVSFDTRRGFSVLNFGDNRALKLPSVLNSFFHRFFGAWKAVSRRPSSKSQAFVNLNPSLPPFSTIVTPYTLISLFVRNGWRFLFFDGNAAIEMRRRASSFILSPEKQLKVSWPQLAATGPSMGGLPRVRMASSADAGFSGFLFWDFGTEPFDSPSLGAAA